MRASQVTPGFDDIVNFLSKPAAYGAKGFVKKIETHGAIVFLVGDEAYKLKRRVRFPYMDFSTLPKRRAACESEIAVNKANAPELYLGVIPLTYDGSRLHLGGDGKVVDFVVHLRRFNEEETFDRLPRQRLQDPGLIDDLAHVVAMAHRRALPCDGRFAANSLRQHLIETLDELVDCADLCSFYEIEELRILLISAFEHSRPLLKQRVSSGNVRRCHGDLHLRNIALIDGKPVLFDAIEFNNSLAEIDTLYDLAFLLMDLCENRCRASANRLLNRYIWDSDEEFLQVEGLRLLPFFLSLRALIRAKVTLSLRKLGGARPELCTQAQGYFRAARHFLDKAPVQLVAVGGLSGSGKSTLATWLAPSFGAAPGALHLRSDIERKHLFQVRETVRLPKGSYATDTTGPVYHRLHDLVAIALQAGRSVIVDATYQNRDQRHAIESVARRLSVPFTGIWLQAPIDKLKERVASRSGDASDADVSVVELQAKSQMDDVRWKLIDASGPKGRVAEAAARHLGIELI